MKLKFKKGIFTIVLCCMMLLTGCSTITYTRVVYEDGSLKDVYEVTFDQATMRQSFMQAGYTESEANIWIRQYCIKTYEIMNSYVEKLKSSFQFMSYEAVADGKMTNEERLTLNGQILWLIDYDRTTYSYIKYVRSFATAEAFDEYNDLYSDGDGGEDGYILEDGLFFYKYSIAVDNFYQSIKEALQEQDNAFGVTYEQLLEYFERDVFSEDDIEVVQSYISMDNRLHTNADYVAEEDGYYLQEWNISTTTPTKLKYFYYIANTTNWYLLAMGIALGVVVLIGGYVFIKKQLNKTDKKEKSQAK